MFNYILIYTHKNIGGNEVYSLFKIRKPLWEMKLFEYEPAEKISFII